MIYEVLIYIKRKLETGLSGGRASAEPLIVLSQPWSNNDSNQNSSHLNALSVIGLEEEKIFRQQMPAVVQKPDGQYYKKEPELKLNMFIMFSAYHKNYEDGLKFLSRVIAFFQANCVFQKGAAPGGDDLPDGMEKMQIELFTPGFEEQNQIWAFLGTGYIPSVIYRVRMVVFDHAKADENFNPIVEIKTSKTSM